MFGKKKNKDEVVEIKMNKKSTKKPRKKGSIGFGLLALVLAFLTFVGMMFLQNYLSSQVVYQTVISAKADIPERITITAENASKYLGTKNINMLDMTKNTVTDVNDIIGKQARISLDAGCVLTKNDFEDISIYADGFTDPIEVTIDVSNIANANAGKIRNGDIINVTALMSKTSKSDSAVSYGSLMEPIVADEDVVEPTTETGTETENTTETTATPPETAKTSVFENNGYVVNKESTYVIKNVFVTHVYDSNGVELLASDKESNASLIKFTIERADERDFNTIIGNSDNIRISRVLRKDETQNYEVILDEIDNEAGEEQKMTPEEVTDNLSTPISE